MVSDERAQLDYVYGIFEVCRLADYNDAVFWSPHHGIPWCAVAQCSDWFYWATADAEPILPEDLHMFRDCLEDLHAVEVRSADGGDKNDQVATAYLPQLFACRKRKMRPMRCVYEDKDAIGPLLAGLFDAAGPPREDQEGKRG